MKNPLKELIQRDFDYLLNDYGFDFTFEARDTGQIGSYTIILASKDCKLKFYSPPNSLPQITLEIATLSALNERPKNQKEWQSYELSWVPISYVIQMIDRERGIPSEELPGRYWDENFGKISRPYWDKIIILFKNENYDSTVKKLMEVNPLLALVETNFRYLFEEYGFYVVSNRHDWSGWDSFELILKSKYCSVRFSSMSRDSDIMLEVAPASISPQRPAAYDPLVAYSRQWLDIRKILTEINTRSGVLDEESPGYYFNKAVEWGDVMKIGITFYGEKTREYWPKIFQLFDENNLKETYNKLHNA